MDEQMNQVGGTQTFPGVLFCVADLCVLFYAYLSPCLCQATATSTRNSVITCLFTQQVLDEVVGDTIAALPNAQVRCVDVLYVACVSDLQLNDDLISAEALVMHCERRTLLVIHVCAHCCSAPFSLSTHRGAERTRRRSRKRRHSRTRTRKTGSCKLDCKQLNRRSGVVMFVCLSWLYH